MSLLVALPASNLLNSTLVLTEKLYKYKYEPLLHQIQLLQPRQPLSYPRPQQQTRFKKKKNIRYHAFIFVGKIWQWIQLEILQKRGSSKVTSLKNLKSRIQLPPYNLSSFVDAQLGIVFITATLLLCFDSNLADPTDVREAPAHVQEAQTNAPTHGHGRMLKARRHTIYINNHQYIGLAPSAGQARSQTRVFSR